MPDVTADHLIPYPVGGDRVLIPKDMKALADRMEVIESNQDGVISTVEGATAIILDFTDPLVSLPSAPADGERIIAKVGTGLAWQFYWDDVDQVWPFIGGAPLQATIFTEEPRSANTYSNLTTVGPQLTLPLGMGTIHADLTIGCDMQASGDGAGNWMSYSVNGDTAVDSRGIQQSNAGRAHVRWMRRASFDSGDVLIAKYKSSGSAPGSTYADRQFSLVPAWLVP
jgi:hypothetical protein